MLLELSSGILIIIIYLYRGDHDDGEPIEIGRRYGNETR
jgi:hypothetical protein